MFVENSMGHFLMRVHCAEKWIRLPGRSEMYCQINVIFRYKSHASPFVMRLLGFMARVLIGMSLVLLSFRYVYYEID